MNREMFYNNKQKNLLSFLDFRLYDDDKLPNFISFHSIPSHHVNLL